MKNFVINDSKLLQIMPLGDYTIQIFHFTKLDRIDNYFNELKILVELKAKRSK